LLHIGTDEAGYGPLLGPLVVAGAVYDASRRDRLPRRGIDDSKVVYGRGGRRALAAVLGPYLGLGPPVTLSRLLARCSVRGDPRSGYPWYGEVEDGDVSGGAPPRSFRRLYVAPLCERDFNAACTRRGGKGDVLFEETMGIVRAALADHPADDADVVCDKHGGRNRYAGPLMAELGPSAIVPERESRDLSSYRLTLAGRQVRIRFRKQADAGDTPAALASMAAKYVRELFMEAFNRFFAERLPEVRPTAGYYGDARRFLRDVAPVLGELGGPDSLVRVR